MKLEIQYTEEDLREANGYAYAQGGAKARRSIWVGIVGWILFLIVMAVLWLLLKRDAYGIRNGPEPANDLTLALLPSAVAAICFLAFVIATLQMQLKVARMRAAFGKAGYDKVKRSGWAGIMVLVVMGALSSPQFVPAIKWHGGRYATLMLAFVPWIVVVFVLIVILKLYNRAVIRNTWEQKPSLRRPHVFEVNDEQFVSSDVNSTSAFRWSAFLRFRETENLFILVTEDSNFIMVPKRALGDPELMTGFRAMIQTHIAEGYFLTAPAPGFPVLMGQSLPPPPIGK
ncbi:MAG TPA: YcxB family protein [Tepidisphaeraceae bacterium]|nr:YcxB family protein [Tepidisphaeraceae bacterium]